MPNIINEGPQQDKQISTLYRANFEEISRMITEGNLSLDTIYHSANPVRNTSTPLHLIVTRKENNKLLEWILINQTEIDLNVKTKSSYTPLAVAATYGNIGAIKLLIAYGANSEIKTSNGKTPRDIWCQKHPNEGHLIDEAIQARQKAQNEGRLPERIYFKENANAYSQINNQNKQSGFSQNVKSVSATAYHKVASLFSSLSKSPWKKEDEKDFLLQKVKKE